VPITPADPFKWKQYPGEVILLCVRWYLRFPLSYAHVAEMMNEWGLLTPGDALIVGAAGTNVAIVRPDHTVHIQKIEVGRDYGDRLEVISGPHEGNTIIPNPGDLAREGLKVNPVPLAEKGSQPAFR
jgi:hypothetical protein